MIRVIRTFRRNIVVNRLGPHSKRRGEDVQSERHPRAASHGRRRTDADVFPDGLGGGYKPWTVDSSLATKSPHRMRNQDSRPNPAIFRPSREELLDFGRETCIVTAPKA